ncbi:MAG: endonuclease III [Gemmatimonadetes bacterium]|nr:endonuclease III [Gemmatimonadota bacterium]
MAGKPVKRAKTAKRSGRTSTPPAKKRPGKAPARAVARRLPPAAVRIGEILARLKQAYPDAHCALEHTSPYELLVATILSAQCTDARVNMVTPALFAKYPGPAALAGAAQADVEALVQSTGFFRNKAKNLIAMAQAVMAQHGGEIPRTMDQLHALPGVGRKTANVVLGNAFGINAGVTVDTHVTRLSNLLGLTTHQDAVKIEQDLIALVPQDDWTLVSHLLIMHGRGVCIANRPRCGECVLAALCPSARPT